MPRKGHLHGGTGVAQRRDGGCSLRAGPAAAGQLLQAGTHHAVLLDHIQAQLLLGHENLRQRT